MYANIQPLTANNKINKDNPAAIHSIKYKDKQDSLNKINKDNPVATCNIEIHEYIHFTAGNKTARRRNSCRKGIGRSQVHSIWTSLHM